jgi:hypothetical protein
MITVTEPTNFCFPSFGSHPEIELVTLISLNTRRDTDFTTMTRNHPELVQILEIFIYLFGKYRDFTYRKDNNPNGQLQSTTPTVYTFEASN